MNVRTAWLAWLLCAGAALGQGMIVPDRWWDDRWIPVPPGAIPLQTKSQKVSAEIHGFAATTIVEQSFYNQYPHRIEGTFLFALPELAGMTNFSMSIGGEQVAAELLDARRAREVYEQIVRSMRDPGLLEYIGRDTFRARIFPIEPHETKVIRLEYTQAVPADDGLARFVFPLRSRAGTQPVRPPIRPLETRFIVPPGPDGTPAPSRVDSLAVDVRIESEIGIKSVYSPSHEIDLHRQSEHVVRVGHEASDVVPDRDFVLYYQLSDAMFGVSLICQRGAGEEQGTFMMLVAPKSDLREEEIVAKDIVFVFDVSGSMAGAKVEQAKGALRYCLNNLNEGDRFNIIAFSTEVQQFEDGLAAIGPDALRAALEFVDGLRARGGTNIDEALARGLALLPGDAARPGMMLFMTDGLPTVGETKPQRILENAGAANRAEARMFVFGVGNDVNTMLLDRLTEDNRGTRTYVQPEEDIETAVSSLYAKVSSPVLSDLKLSVTGVTVSSLQPITLPDLFRGSQLTLLGRYEGEGAAQVVLRGNAGGQEQVFEYSLDFPQRERLHPFVPRLWATRRVGYLLDQIRLNGEAKELVDEVVELATRYGILTPYTSYLVLEPGMKPETEAMAGLAGGRFRGPQGPPGAGGAPATDLGGGMPARPSDAVTGEAAVRRSQAEGELRMAERDDAASTVATRDAAGRTFYGLAEDWWVDSTVPAETEGLTVVKVKYASEAYFELLDLRQEMREILAVGTRLKARFGDVILIVDEDEGEEALTDVHRQALRE